MKDLLALKIKAFLGLNNKSMETDTPEHQAQTIQNFEISRKPGALVKSPGYALATSVLGANYTSANKIAKSGGSIGAIEQIFEYYVPYRGETWYIAQTADDALWYWNNTSSVWTQFDDKITNTYPTARFLQRGGVLITAAGTDSNSYPIWYGYLNREKDVDENGYFGNAQEYVGYYCSKASIDKPILDNDATGNITFGTLNQLTGAGDMDESEGYRLMYRISFVYDGFQESLLNEEMTDIILTGASTAAVKFDLVFDSTTFNDTNNDYYFNKRITAIKVYRAYLTGISTWSELLSQTVIYTRHGNIERTRVPHEPRVEVTPGIFRSSEFYLLNHVDINEGTILPYAEGYGAVTTVAAVTTLVDGNLADDYSIDDKWNNFSVKLIGDSGTEYIKITDYDHATATLTLASAPTDGDGAYEYAIISRWYTDGSDYKITLLDSYGELSEYTDSYITDVNHTAENISPNYGDAVYIHNRMFVGPVYFNGQYNSDWVMWSNINGDGAYAVDVFPSLNVIKVSDLGIREVKRLGSLLDRLIIFGDTDIAMLSIASGSEFGWELDDTYQDVGLYAANSLVNIDGKYYYLSSDGVRVFDGNSSMLISVPIEDVDNFPFNVTTLSEAVAWHDPEKKQYIIHWKTDELTYAYDLLTGEWIQPSYADEVDCVIETADGEILTCDGVSVVLHNSGTDHNGTAITPSWKSRVYNMMEPNTHKILVDYYISYRSNTAIEFNVYVDRGTSAETMTNQTLAAATTETTAQEHFPIGTRGYEFEFEVSLDSDLVDDNTYLEINEIVVRYALDERA